VAGVPPTALVSIPTGDWRHIPERYMQAEVADGVKTGSLQVYVPSKCCAGDLGYSNFSAAHVQRIALLDMRLFNVDRHDGNILVQESLTTDGNLSYSLTPIDHGFCLPDNLQLCSFDWCWFTWPQVKRPIPFDLRHYILNLNIDRDANLLKRAIGIRDKCVQTFLVASRFVQTLVLRCPFLSLYDIASLMSRCHDADEPSRLERIVMRARWRAACDMVMRKRDTHTLPPTASREHTSACTQDTHANDLVVQLWRSLYLEAFYKQIADSVEELCLTLQAKPPLSR